MEINERTFKNILINFVIRKPDQCWNWIGFKDKDGRGKVWVKDRKEIASRVLYFISNGKIDKNLCVCHSCDNPSCVNPNHLWLGTKKENTHDMIRKNRHRKKNTPETILRMSLASLKKKRDSKGRFTFKSRRE